MCIELVIYLCQALFCVLAYIETHNGHGPSVHGRGIHIFYSWYLPDELLHGVYDPGLYLGRGGPRHTDQHIHHGDHYLGLFLAGSKEYGKDTEE